MNYCEYLNNIGNRIILFFRDSYNILWEFSEYCIDNHVVL